MSRRRTPEQYANTVGGWASLFLSDFPTAITATRRQVTLTSTRVLAPGRSQHPLQKLLDC
eukprot:m.328040 g.328040  ORF g.328040 m.328040 type:complete len:60 (-) comp16499_c0_seq1:60-239(-)